MELIFLLIGPLWAQGVVIQTTEAPRHEYERYLLENPHRKSYVEGYGGEKSSWKGELMSRLKKAQYEFLDGSLEKALKDFERITELRHKRDWSKEERRTIYYAFLRRAQLLKKKREKEALMREAVFFAPTWTPDPQLFPPPLREAFFKIRKTITEKVWPLPQGADKFEKILLNGRTLKKSQSFVKTHRGLQRFSFISNRYKPVHIVSDIQTLSQSTLPLVALASGDCENPRFIKEVQGKNVWGFYSPDCVLSSYSRGISLKLPTPMATQMDEEQKEHKKVSTKINPWIWTGLGVLSTFVTWELLKDGGGKLQPPKPQPIHKHLTND